MAVPPGTAPGGSTRVTKRAAGENSSSDEPPPKKGFIARTFGRARNALSSSSSDAASSPPTQRTAGGSPPMTAIEMLPPVPTDPAERAMYTSKCVDALAAQRAKEKEMAEFKAATPNFNLNINQHDKAWMDKREEFINLLKDENKTPMGIFAEQFPEADILYLLPPEDDGIILTIQKEHTQEYKDALSATGRFRGVPDNLATKLTMLHFGLPIEPVTFENVKNCSKVDKDGKYIDKSDEPDPPEPAPRIQRVIWAEKPLEFLDKYDDGRSYGYPKLRTAKRRDLPLPQRAFVPNAPAPLSVKPPSGKGAGTPPVTRPPSGNGGGEAPVPATPGETSTPTGNGVETAPILPAPVANARIAPHPRDGKGGYHGGGNQQPQRNESYINPGQFTVSMRGGAGSPEGPDAEPVPQPKHIKYIYGYLGRILAENNNVSFLKTALRLLEYDFKNKPDYSFLVDIYPNGREHPADTTITITKSNYDETFPQFIKPNLDERDDEKRAIFVRTSSSAPPGTPIQPDEIDIIRLHFAGNTSYWKITRDLFNSEVFRKKMPAKETPDMGNEVFYGINQCQPAFFRAMKLLFEPHSPRLHGPVSLRAGKDSWGLGFDGMEATEDLWQFVCEQAKLSKRNTPQILQFSVIIGMNELSQNLIGAHLTGSHHETHASIVNPRETYSQIEQMSEEYLREKRVPESIRIWHTAEEREQDVEFNVTKLKKNSTALESLGDYLEGWEGRTHCIWWRPEFGIFNIVSVENNREVQWDTRGRRQGLRDFKKSTKSLSADGNGFESFVLLEAQSAHNARRFVVTKDTTEDEWRMHIYDWLHSRKLFIREIGKIDAIPYVLSQKSTYGVSLPIAVPAPQSTKPPPSTTTPQPNTTTRPKTISQPKPIPQTATRNPFGPTTNARMNKERIVAAAAGKPKSQTWSDWMTEQHFQDGLQRKSWIRDQSVVEPGRMPAPPLFGPSRELQLRVGSSMPTIYAHRLTPTDIKQLQDENQKLRNQVLDRMNACPICSEVFEAYETDNIRDHVKQHQKQLEEGGQCPSCGDPQWVFMTNDEKRSHFAIHQYHNESATIKQFYKDQHCPVCDRDLSKLTPEKVIHHCLEHAPGQVQYCDRCGLGEKDCNTEELQHHRNKCRLAKDRYPFEPEPVFCNNCGLDVTRATPDDNIKHQKNCRKGPKGRFCVQCGLNMSMHHWNQEAIDKHNSHCMPPSGLKKKFCEKCRAEMASLDAIGRSHHQQTCRSVEPAVPSEQARIAELKKRQDLARQMEARLNSHRAYIEGRDRELTARETALAASEKRVAEQQAELNHLTVQVHELQRAQGDGHTAPGNTDSDAANCPIPGCSTIISGMTKAKLINHIKLHSETKKAPPFLCPLEHANGDRCNRHLSLANNGFDLTVHYVHKLSEEEQEAITRSISGAKGDSAILKHKIFEAKNQQMSNVNFINQRIVLLDPTTAALSSSAHLPPATAPPAAQPAQGTKLATTPAPAPQRKKDKQPEPPLHHPSMDYQMNQDDDEFSPEGKATTTAAKLKQNWQPKAYTAVVQAGAATHKTGKEEYEDLGFDSMTREASEETEDAPPPKEKVPPTEKATKVKAPPVKAPKAKATTMKSKKRKQAEVEEDEVEEDEVEEDEAPPSSKKSTRTGRANGAGPAKKQKKEEERKLPTKASVTPAKEPKKRMESESAKVKVTPPKKTGRPKGKGKEEELVVTVSAMKTPLKVTKSPAKRK